MSATTPNRQTHPLLTAPALPTIARMAWPTTLVMIAQAGVSIAETWVVGRLGTEALAGFALVFPVAMLMTMMAAGGIGGGIAGAIARATGAGRTEDARALALHALVIALGFALLFTVALRLFGADLYRSLGGLRADATGGDIAKVLAFAVAYSDTLFAGAIATWAMFALSAILRGAGDVATPGKLMLTSSLLQVPLTWMLVLGIGGWSGMGIAGAGLSAILTNGLSAVLMWRRLRAGAAGFVPSLTGIPLRTALFAPILRVGLMASTSALTANLTTVFVTLLVAGFGVGAIAGYGVGARLEFILVPLSFGIGSALTTLVGVASGAGDWARARRVAWIGAAMSAALTGSVGLVAALLPNAWMSIFSADPQVHAAGVAYLTRVAPFYAFFGVGTTLSFASQGAGRMAGPLTVSILRFAIAAIGGFLVVRVFGHGLDGLFWVVAGAIVVMGSGVAAGLALFPWGPRR